MAEVNYDHLRDSDHLLGAKQMMGQYWNRDDVFVVGELDESLSRIAGLLEVIAEAQISIAESQYHLAEGVRARK